MIGKWEDVSEEETNLIAEQKSESPIEQSKTVTV